MTRKTPNKLKHIQVVQLADILKMACITTPDGFNAYKAGWSDEMVLEKMPGISVSALHSLKIAMFGKNAPPKKAATLVELTATVNRLAAAAEALQERVKRLEDIVIETDR
jgi:hypothetical protein